MGQQCERMLGAWGARTAPSAASFLLIHQAATIHRSHAADECTPSSLRAPRALGPTTRRQTKLVQETTWDQLILVALAVQWSWRQKQRLHFVVADLISDEHASSSRGSFPQRPSSHVHTWCSSSRSSSHQWQVQQWFPLTIDIFSWSTITTLPIAGTLCNGCAKNNPETEVPILSTFSDVSRLL